MVSRYEFKRALLYGLIGAVWTLACVFAFPKAVNSDCTSALSCISEALDLLGQGLAEDSVNCLRQALDQEPNNLLAHTTLGYALLLGGRYDQAMSKFETVLRMDPDCAPALYGCGIVFLTERSYAQAANCFREAQSLAGHRNLSSSLEYVRTISTGQITSEADATQNFDSPTDEARLALSALTLMKGGKYDEAAEIWIRLQASSARECYGERPGCTMTFLPQRPVAITGQRISSSASGLVVPAQAVKTVNGKITLRADLRRVRNVRIVTFAIDDKLLGVTNQPPFECVWDTARWPNGPHTVKIVGLDESGAVISEKTTLVAVNNPTSSPGNSKADKKTEPLWDRLWDLMMLKPSSAAINYHLSLCARRRADVEAEKTALERVVAADPDYRDASWRLGELYRSTGSTDLIYTPAGTKSVVALTFDDGPKTETTQLLDVLKSKGVKATFFVVGKQCEKYPDVLKRISDEGHALGNHTYSHSALEYLHPQAIEKEIFRCQVAVRDITGREMRLIRPPGAHFGDKVKTIARKFGLRIVLYSANCSKVEGTTAEKIAKFVISSAKPGAVILMHNLDRVTLQALPRIIDELRAKGYDFVTL